MRFYKLGVGLEEGMAHVAEQRVEDRFTRQDMGAGAGERGETSRGVIGPSGANGIAEEGHLKAGVKCIKSGLVDANRRLKAAHQKVFGWGEGVADGVVGERRKCIFTEGRCTRSGRKKFGRGAAELGRDLFGKDHAQAEAVGGGCNKLAPAQETLPVGHSAEEDRLHVDAEDGDAGGGWVKRSRIHEK